MKKLVTLLALVAGLFACVANAAFVETTVTASGAAAYSDQIPASGYLDRIEIIKSGDNDVVDIDVATFSGTTIVDGLVDINALATATDTVVIRPRRVGTGVSGTALAGALGANAGTNVTQVLVAPYERPMVGGNLKLKVTAGAGTNATVTARFYFERVAN